ncbi:DNA-binding XRE family transcriptional regulator [Chryseobacterium sp. 7]|uniref:helix-turn-helix domain-containing protein n=1 Tax=Chryseobacterium sp. 7 TaxID=2035214 RepID=UPI000EAC1A72|nr:helix-turn-helix transcriptional regulator [Chryseobacterium sp. 7]RLJ31174.1 DNA-binding XRE family transcriptional regulator [Chryseobacterium sp. 7]
MNENQFFINLGANISSIRIKKGINQDDLAKFLDLSRPSIVNIEKGKQKPSIYTLILIANYLMVDIKDLLPEVIPAIERGNIIGVGIDPSIFSQDRDFVKFMRIVSKNNK